MWRTYYFLYLIILFRFVFLLYKILLPFLLPANGNLQFSTLCPQLLIVVWAQVIAACCASVFAAFAIPYFISISIIVFFLF